jgi:hypothetical protein
MVPVSVVPNEGRVCDQTSCPPFKIADEDECVRGYVGMGWGSNVVWRSSQLKKVVVSLHRLNVILKSQHLCSEHLGFVQCTAGIMVSLQNGGGKPGKARVIVSLLLPEVIYWNALGQEVG